MIRSRWKTYRKSGGTRDGDNVLSLSQHPRQSDLTSGSVIPLANLLQTVHEPEDVGEVLLGVPCNSSAEVVVLKVIRRFLQRVQWDVPPSPRGDSLT